jgi:hypothetical protein
MDSARRAPRLALAGASGGDGGGSAGDGGGGRGLSRAIELLQRTRLELIEEIRRELEQPAAGPESENAPPKP